ncbi:hypothetical protein FH608_039410 [Nonomuraea phyllanthi]|uniref:Uncharacterized protein n=1 Tax=Nonomuraea phyllanthi TaxID=2219224 RepID=A0A5C4VNU3_9ACTN|nr:hypothetical protein [Nonomuraea phyllanthi]KAB8189654.1 hypothetical protein FH608_039410 [Nonomuraea phyllanthi]QFY11993.1 hypothetical protein GBF35_40325 [Nonomuraea phyllanthi]
MPHPSAPVPFLTLSGSIQFLIRSGLVQLLAASGLGRLLRAGVSAPPADSHPHDGTDGNRVPPASDGSAHA